MDDLNAARSAIEYSTQPRVAFFDDPAVDRVLGTLEFPLGNRTESPQLGRDLPELSEPRSHHFEPNGYDIASRHGCSYGTFLGRGILDLKSMVPVLLAADSRERRTVDTDELAKLERPCRIDRILEPRG